MKRVGRRKAWLLEWALPALVALVGGAGFVFLVPPWQHYDEPTHFERVWLTAHRPDLLRTGGGDETLRRAILDSMVRHGFFGDEAPPVDPSGAAGPVSIGIPQFDDPPLYYWYASLPLRLLDPGDIDGQLILARLASLTLLVGTVILATGILRLLLPRSPWARTAIVIGLATLPGFLDIMTSVNNDVGAIFVVTGFLYLGCVSVRRGLSLLRLGMLAAMLAAAFLTKNTAYVVFLLAPVVLVYALDRHPGRRVANAVLAIGLVATVLAVFDFSRMPAHWLVSYADAGVQRARTEKAVDGRWALRLQSGANRPDVRVSQVLGKPEEWAEMAREYVVSGWVWAESEFAAPFPLFLRGAENPGREVQVGRAPRFFSQRVVLDLEQPILRLEVRLPEGWEKPGRVLWLDGLSVRAVRGEGASGGSGKGEELLRNGSFEYPRLGLRPWAEAFALRAIGGAFAGTPEVMLATFLSPEAARLYLEIAAPYLFETFWARLGWGNVPLLWRPAYSLLALWSALGLGGWAVRRLRRSRSGDLAVASELLPFLALTVLAAWAIAVARGAGSMDQNWIYFPTARYAMVAVLPTVAFLILGWYMLLPEGWRQPGRRWLAVSAALAPFPVTLLLSIVTLLRFF